jgi:predicted lipoprotein with Yx(FWY)xxD motif
MAQLASLGSPVLQQTAANTAAGAMSRKGKRDGTNLLAKGGKPLLYAF